jgi:hypothetical protein
MTKNSVVLFFLMAIFSSNAYAIFYEIDFNFGYDKQLFGASRQNSIITRNYSTSVAAYFFTLTALEFTYARNDEVFTYNESVAIDVSRTIVSNQNTVDSDVYSIGIRQSLAPKKSLIAPMISVGYAKQFIQDSTDYTVDDNGTRTVYIIAKPKRRIDSMFATFALKFNFTQTFSIKGSVNTMIEAFKYNQAKDNLKYSAGFSWIF